jgi:DNA-binding transcriptional ArsR family regulator
MPRRAEPAHEPRLARIASLVADASRSRMLCYLLDGEMASAGELAAAASVSPATASGHLAQLLDAGLLVCEPRGRHRYYRLADGDVAHALEALAMVAERTTHSRSWQHPARQRLRQARCCYGHIAGELGVALLQGMQNKGWLVPREDAGFAVSAPGAQALDALGLDGAAWQRRSQTPAGARVAYGCIDWSERRDHMAGKLAVALLAHFVQKGWLLKTEGDRALSITPRGRHALQTWVGVG